MVVNRMPDEQRMPEPSQGWSQQMAAQGAASDAHLRGQMAPTQRRQHEWGEFSTWVESEELFQRYQQYFNSDARSLQHYGRVVVVSDQFLGSSDASGTATAMTTLAEVPHTLPYNAMSLNALLRQGPRPHGKPVTAGGLHVASPDYCFAMLQTSLLTVCVVVISSASRNQRVPCDVVTYTWKGSREGKLAIVGTVLVQTRDRSRCSA